MSSSQPPPNPYGNQPQGGGYGQPQPGPPPQGGGYGQPQQPPQPPQPGYGYPQQAPQPGPPATPYGQPPQQQPGYGQPPQQQPGYGQQPPYGQMPQQGGYGYPQPPQPAQGSGKGKRNGIIIGVVVVLVAVGAGLFIAHKNGSGSSSLADNGKKYTLTTPDTVAGDYTKSVDFADSSAFDDSDLAKLKALGVSNPTQVDGGYVKGSEDTGNILDFGGVYGTVKDPGKALDGMFAMLDKGAKVKTVGSPQSVHPTGMKSDALMKCQQVDESEQDSGQTVTIHTTVCVWADYSTVAYIIPLDPAAAIAGGGTAPSISDASDLTAKVRDDVEVEAS